MSSVKEGTTKTYNFERKEIVLGKMENTLCHIVDSNGNILDFGMPKEYLLELIQELIERNDYELKKKEWENAKEKE